MLQPKREIEYPCSDGLPMSDKEVHLELMINTRFALKEWFKDQRVHVASNLLLYYVEGDPKQRIAPDVYVAKGVSDHLRPVYKLWEEGVMPQVTFEFSSRSSRHLDPEFKVPLYEQLGTSEVYLFDPEARWLPPRFQVKHRFGRRFKDVDASSGRVFSPALGLEIRVIGDDLRLFNPATGEMLETPAEASARAQRETSRANQEAARADQEAARADQEAARAEREAARVRELEERLRQLGGG